MLFVHGIIIQRSIRVACNRRLDFFGVKFDRTLSLGRNDLRTFLGLRAPTSEVEFKSRELSAKPIEAAVTWLVITANLPSCRNINPGPKQQNADYSAQKLIENPYRETGTWYLLDLTTGGTAHVLQTYAINANSVRHAVSGRAIKGFTFDKSD
jgi:hypothetical protein